MCGEYQSEREPEHQSPRAVMDRLDIGTGSPILLLPGYGLRPHVYLRSAKAAVARGQMRIIVPSLYGLPGRWTSESVADQLAATLDHLGLERVTMIAHSFSGCVQLGFAAKYPDRIERLIFCDTLAWTREWPLARQALRPSNLVLLATAGAAIDFARTWLFHPLHLAEAGWRGFVGNLRSQIDEVASSGIPSHVLWAQRDTLLRQQDGRAFASELGATFEVLVPRPDGKTVDHNWPYRCPKLFADYMERLAGRAQRTASRGEQG